MYDYTYCFSKYLVNLEYFQVEIKWKFQRYPELVGTCKRVTYRSENRIRGALTCSGDYQIHPEVSSKFKVNPSVWMAMDQEKRNKHFNRFLSPPLPKDPTIVSQCGLYEMHSPGRVQRKPHQMVTPRNERASSKKTPKSDTTPKRKDTVDNVSESEDPSATQSDESVFIRPSDIDASENPLSALLSQDNILQGNFGKNRGTRGGRGRGRGRGNVSNTDKGETQTSRGRGRGRGRPRKIVQTNKENVPK